MDMSRIFRNQDVFSASVLSLELPTPSEVLEAVEPWL
jgi:hypothetical protein